MSEPLARLGAQVTAVDSLKENIIVAQLRAQAQSASGLSHVHFYDRLRYINCAVEDLAVVEENWGYFDGVVMSEVVEHVNNLDEFMKNSIKLLKVSWVIFFKSSSFDFDEENFHLKNKGFVFITTINKTPQSYALAIVAAEYLLNLVPRGTHSWDKFVKPEDLSSILEKSTIQTGTIFLFTLITTKLLYFISFKRWNIGEIRNGNVLQSVDKELVVVARQERQLRHDCSKILNFV